MIYKNLYAAVIIRIMVAVFMGVFVYESLAGLRWGMASIGILSLIISMAEFLNYINSVNRKLSYFFDAIKSEDSTLRFSPNVRGKSLKKLHQSLNNVNKVISDIKIENEKKERFFSELLKFSSSGILAVDNEGYVTYVNHYALKYIGLAHLAHINLLKQKNKKIYSIITSLKHNQPVIEKLVINNEMVHISFRLANLKIENETIRVFSLINIKTELEQNEIDSWQKLIRVLTHEIMNSIAPITSLSNTLKSYFLMEDTLIEKEALNANILENTLEGLTVIEERSKGLEHFVQNYRQLTKIPVPEFKTVLLEKFINRIVLLKQPELDGKAISFETSFIHYGNSNEIKIMADEKLLAQVIINVINNAVDACLKATTDVKKVIQIKAAEIKGGTFKIEITDNGSGINEEDADKIFIPFYTNKENGNGIGLSLCRQIMRLHNGSIHFRSKPGSTTFVLSL